jgi:hypothetical protein
MAGIDTYAKLVLHLDNNVTDSEITPKTVTNNNVTFSDTVKKFGSHSGVFNGTDSYLSVPDSDDWDFVGNNTDSKTIDLWVKLNNTTSNHGFVAQDESKSTYWGFGFQVGSKNIAFILKISGAYPIELYSSANAITDTNWHHVALVKEANKYTIYVDGTSVGTVTDSSTGTAAGSLQVGKLTDGGWNMNGYIDEVRYSYGVARWTANFTPPTSPYSLESRQKSRVVIIA